MSCIKVYLRSTLLFLSFFTSLVMVGQDSCSFKLSLKDRDFNILNYEFAKISVITKIKYLQSDNQGELNLKLPCLENYRLKIEVAGFYSIDTTISSKNIENGVVLLFYAKTILLDSIEIKHNHGVESRIEDVQEEIQIKNIQNSSQLFSQFSAIQSTSKSSTIQKPILRYFHSQRLSYIEDKIPIRDHSWGLDHGLETGLSQIYDINYSTDSRPIYADYGALFVNQDVFAKPSHSKISLDYNHVNRKKHLGLFLNKFYKVHYFSFASDLESSENLRVNSQYFNYLNSRISLIDNQLSNTGRDKFYFNFNYKFKEKFSFGIANNYTKTGLFSGASGKANAYTLINSNQMQLPYQIANHFKIHGHYQKLWSSKSAYALDFAYQKNTRKEFERAAFHGYNPLTTDTLGVLLNFQNIDLHQSFFIHLDSNWCLKANETFNLGKNSISGFDFIIPEYTQLENRGNVSLEYLSKKNSSFSLLTNYQIKKYQLEAHQIEVYQNNNLLGKIVSAESANRNFSNFGALFNWDKDWSKTFETRISTGSASRIPEINELSSFGAHHGSYRFEKGNLDLNNERNYNIQGDFYWINKWFKTSLAVYAYHFSNFIYLSPSNQFASAEMSGEIIALPVTGQLYSYKQNRANIFGGELEVEEKIKTFLLKHSFFYTLTKNLDTQLPLPFTAQANLKNTISYTPKSLKNENANLKILLEHNVFFAQNRVDRNERKTPMGNSLDFFGEMKIYKKLTLIQFNFGIQNLLNQKYYIHISEYRFLNITEPSRNLFFRSTIEF